jgi:hypothetical protein
MIFVRWRRNATRVVSCHSSQQQQRQEGKKGKEIQER